MSGAAGQPRLTVHYDDRFLAHEARGHPESPDRLRAITGALRAEPGLESTSWVAAEPADEADLLRFHTHEHLASLQELSRRGGGWVDADTFCGEASYGIATLAAGATLGALRTSCAGGPALALVRPPGHHATPERAMGFCLLNNVGIAVGRALREPGVERVAVVDLDVHHGNGTQDGFYQDSRVLYCSLHQLPLYPGSGRRSERGEGEGLGKTLNLPQPPGTGPGPWLAALRDEALPALRRHRPQLIVVSAGFDALEGDPLAQLRLLPETYSEAARMLQGIEEELSALPSVWVLEGGYLLERVADAVRRCSLVLARA